MELNTKNKSELKVGLYSSILLAVLTIVAFGFAMTAIPPAGPYCPGNCMEYPFKDILMYYPRDYYWMYIAIFLLMTYMVFMVSNHYNTPQEKRIYSSLGVIFAAITSTVLLITYYVQFAVIPISMIKGETEGIAILTQYNGHGIFIALEELGYILMSVGFLFLAFAFSKNSRLEKSIRLTLYLPIIITVLSFIIYTIQYGLDRDYRFEVFTLSINWLVCIAVGILASILYRRQLKTLKP